LGLSERPLDGAQTETVFAAQDEYAPAAHPQCVGIHRSSLDRLPRHAHAFGNFFVGDRAVRPFDDATPSKQTRGRGVRRVERQRPSQQADRLTRILRRPLSELRKGTQI
jgi:hypothetical protein